MGGGVNADEKQNGHYCWHLRLEVCTGSIRLPKVKSSSLQFVRKLSGFNKPSKANETAFNCAVEEVAAAARKLLDSLVTNAQPRDREVEAERARAKAAERFGTS